MSDTPQFNSIMIDCLEPERLVEFWSRLLQTSVRHQEGPFTWLAPTRKGGWSLAFQQVPDPTPGKNKLHLDGEYEDLPELTAKVTELGGRLVEEMKVPGFVWNIYADPEDNLFCFGHAL